MISDQKRSVPQYNGMFHAMRTIVKQEVKIQTMPFFVFILNAFPF